jgi:hypothetical protein
VKVNSIYNAFGAVILLAIIATLAAKPKIVHDVLSGTTNLITAAKRG